MVKDGVSAADDHTGDPAPGDAGFLLEKPILGVVQGGVAVASRVVWLLPTGMVIMANP